MKKHDGFKSINKTDGGKGRARKALHKAVRQVGKKLATETKEELHPCQACLDEMQGTHRFPMAKHTCMDHLPKLKPCPICLGPAIRHPDPRAADVLCGCEDNDCVGKMWQGIDFWQALLRPTKPIKFKRTV